MVGLTTRNLTFSEPVAPFATAAARLTYHHRVSVPFCPFGVFSPGVSTNCSSYWVLKIRNEYCGKFVTLTSEGFG